MIKLDDEQEEYHVRHAKPGMSSWLLFGAASLCSISGIFFWTSMTIVSGTGDDLDEVKAQEVMRLTQVFSTPVDNMCLVLAFLFSAFFLGRLHFLSTKYSYSKRLASMFPFFAYLAFFPLVMQVQSIFVWAAQMLSDGVDKVLAQFTSTSHHLGFFSGMAIVTAGGSLAFGVTILLLAFFVLRWILFSQPVALRYSEGLVLTMYPWKILWGSKLIHWSDIRKASIRRTKDKKDLLVIQTDKFKYELPWHSIQFDAVDFMNDLRSKCPPEVLDSSLALREELKHDAGTYTELWLKYFSASTSRQRSSKLAPGEKLHDHKYEIAGELGAGGQGTAYLASMNGSASASRTVVLKEYILPVHRGDSIFQQSMRKLKQEAEILEKIQHPNIVQLIDTFVEDHRGYLVMEYVEGRTLKALVQAEGKQQESTVIDLALQICDILEHLHSMDPSIIHRDLTPDNLILQPDGKLKLVDFNVAHKLESSATATVVGKHAYLPPEQFRGKPTEQSDIYAFGGTLFFLLTGQEPPPLSSSHPRKVVESVSERLDEIIARATALDLSKRSANANAVREELMKLDGAKEAFARHKFDLTQDDSSKRNSDNVLNNRFEQTGSDATGSAGDGSAVSLVGVNAPARSEKTNSENQNLETDPDLPRSSDSSDAVPLKIAEEEPITEKR